MGKLKNGLMGIVLGSALGISSVFANGSYEARNNPPTPYFVYEFAEDTASFLLFTWLGVAGHIDKVEVYPKGILAKTQDFTGFAFGNIGYYGKYEDQGEKQHEYGHLIHEDELKFLFPIIAGLTSWYGYIADLPQEKYMQLWTERLATQYGKESGIR